MSLCNYFFSFLFSVLDIFRCCGLLIIFYFIFSFSGTRSRHKIQRKAARAEAHNNWNYHKNFSSVPRVERPTTIFARSPLLLLCLCAFLALNQLAYFTRSRQACVRDKCRCSIFQWISFHSFIYAYYIACALHKIYCTYFVCAGFFDLRFVSFTAAASANLLKSAQREKKWNKSKTRTRWKEAANYWFRWKMLKIQYVTSASANETNVNRNNE